MYLKKIRLKNIRCFKDVEIDFDLPGGENRKWTVLLGENGTGKSTILKAIGLLLAGSDALADLVKDPEDWIRKSAQSGFIEGEIETKNGEVRNLKLSFKRGKRFSVFLSDAEETLKPLNDALEYTERSYPVFGYGASRRLSNKNHSPDGPSGFHRLRAKSMGSLFSRYAELNALEQWAMDLDYRTAGLKMSTVRKVLSDFLPELTFSKIDKQKKTLLFKTKDGLVPLENLSDGYQNVAAWVGDLLYQITEIFDDYKAPLSVRGLLIIDEVDLHLHPKWQRILLDFLDNQLPNMQLVVTTHSVVTAQQTPENSLFYCSRKENQSPKVIAFEKDPGNMLLHELFVTEAFGNISDESIRVENKKDRYRKLHRKSRKTKKDAAEMKEIEATLTKMDEDPRDRIVMTEKQRALYKQLSRQQG